MKQKYVIIYPACHGGRFLGELLTLGEDLYSCYANLLESTTADRLAACTTRYMYSGGWISNETNFRYQHVSDSEKIDLISRHIYATKLSDNFRIITADAFGNDAGIRWSNASRYKLLVDGHSMYYDEDQHYIDLKNSKLPFLHVDMTKFLNPVFPIIYYKKLCYQLGINPITKLASQLHSIWFEKRVKSYYQYCPIITDSMRLLGSEQRKQVLQERYILQYNMAVKNVAKNLEETYHKVKGPDWPAYDPSDNFFDQLPSWVKQECLNFEIVWSELSVIKINNYTEFLSFNKH